MKESTNMFLLIKKAKINPKQAVETLASDLHKSKFISPIDACTCTGNCETTHLQ